MGLAGYAGHTPLTLDYDASNYDHDTSTPLRYCRTRVMMEFSISVIGGEEVRNLTTAATT